MLPNLITNFKKHHTPRHFFFDLGGGQSSAGNNYSNISREDLLMITKNKRICPF